MVRCPNGSLGKASYRQSEALMHQLRFKGHYLHGFPSPLRFRLFSISVKKIHAFYLYIYIYIYIYIHTQDRCYRFFKFHVAE